MHKFLIVALAAISLTACTTTEKYATVGAVGGGVVGAVTTGSVLGTAVGAGIGGVGGAAVAQVTR